jgi:CMP-N-acetylneuraminic acid synthetase
MKVVAFIPIRLNSKRLPGKNLMLMDGHPLCDYIFSTICGVDLIDEKYVFCSDESIKQYMPEKLIFRERDKCLDGDDVRGLEIIDSFVKSVDADIYVLTHTTSPFMRKESFENAINLILEHDYDSVFSAKKLQGYCWYKGSPVNYDLDDIVQTQLIEPVFLETGGFFIFKKEVFTELGRRIGNKPYCYVTDEFESIEIDTKSEFEFAESAAKYLREKKNEKSKNS